MDTDTSGGLFLGGFFLAIVVLQHVLGFIHGRFEAAFSPWD